MSGGGTAARSTVLGDRGPEVGVSGWSELETGNIERTRNRHEGSSGTETRSSTSGAGKAEQGLGGATCARRGSHPSRGEQHAAGIDSR